MTLDLAEEPSSLRLQNNDGAPPTTDSSGAVHVTSGRATFTERTGQSNTAKTLEPARSATLDRVASRRQFYKGQLTQSPKYGRGGPNSRRDSAPLFSTRDPMGTGPVMWAARFSESAPIDAVVDLSPR